MDQYQKIAYDSEQLNDTCRFCLKVCGPSHHWTIFDGGIAEKIMYIASLQIHQSDGLPTLVCNNCRNSVHSSYNFKCQVEKSDRELRQAYSLKQSVHWSSNSIERTLDQLCSSSLDDNSVVTSDQDEIIRREQMRTLNADGNENFILEIENNCDSIHEDYEKSELFFNDLSFEIDGSVVNKDIGSVNFGEINLDCSDASNNDNSSIFDPEVMQDKMSLFANFLDVRPVNEKNEINDDHLAMKNKKKERTKKIDETIETDERKITNYTCDYCSKIFSSYKIFIAHLRIHPEYRKHLKKIPLMENFNREKSVSKVQAIKSENENDISDDYFEDCVSSISSRKHKCSICKAIFSTNHNLQRHQEVQHKHDDAINENSSSQENKEPVKGKKKNKKMRPHLCPVCPKAFAKVQSLKNHIQRHNRVPDVEKRFLCEVCSKCFSHSGSLAAHMRTHTGDKPYICDICNRAFTKSNYLQLHLRTHSGEKPYICQYCKKAFARTNTLARHLTIHTGVARYKCGVCSKTFRRLTSLNEHNYTHTGQRPYSCKLCWKSYNNAGSLYAHNKKCKASSKKINNKTKTFNGCNSGRSESCFNLSVNNSGIMQSNDIVTAF